MPARIDLPKDYLEQEYASRGRSIKDIAREFLVDRSTVKGNLQRYGIPIRDSSLAPLDENVVKRLYREGGSCRTMGREVGASPDRVLRLVHRLGIETRHPQGRRMNLTSEELRGLYWDQGKSSSEIGQMVGVSPSQIREWLAKYEIPRRKAGGEWRKLNFDMDDLTRQYHKEGKSLREIAAKLGCSGNTIRLAMKSAGIPRREQAEATGNHVSLSDSALEFLDGGLLGDGCLTTNGYRAANYRQTSKFREYAEWIAHNLAGFGIGQCKDIRAREGPDPAGKMQKAFDYTSLGYRELLDLRSRWYPDGKKHIPLKDLRMTPTALRQFWLDDGTLRKPRKHKHGYEAVFCTNCFMPEEVNGLAAMLMEKYGIRAKRQPSQNTLRLSNYDVGKFFDVIGPCPVPCYAYKWSL